MKTLFVSLFLLAAYALPTQVLWLPLAEDTDAFLQRDSLALDLRALPAEEKLQIELWRKEVLEDFVLVPAGTPGYVWAMARQRPSRQYQIRVVRARDGVLLAQSERFQVGHPGRYVAAGSAAMLSMPAMIWLVHFLKPLEAPDLTGR